jgi:hypothetical protein
MVNSLFGPVICAGPVMRLSPPALFPRLRIRRAPISASPDLQPGLPASCRWRSHPCWREPRPGWPGRAWFNDKHVRSIVRGKFIQCSSVPCGGGVEPTGESGPWNAPGTAQETDLAAGRTAGSGAVDCAPDFCGFSSAMTTRSIPSGAGGCVPSNRHDSWRVPARGSTTRAAGSCLQGEPMRNPGEKLITRLVSTNAPSATVETTATKRGFATVASAGMRGIRFGLSGAEPS